VKVACTSSPHTNAEIAIAPRDSRDLRVRLLATSPMAGERRQAEPAGTKIEAQYSVSPARTGRWKRAYNDVP
jgi:hypothetical protein